MNPVFLEVCAAVAFRDGKLLLASRRPGGNLAGKWEFPGGKQRDGESLADCIRRELQEELGLEITDALELFSLVHRYPEKTVRLHFMLCDVAEDCHPEAKEGQSFGWHDHRQLNDLDWAPADREACDMLIGDGQLSRMADVSVAEPSRTDQLRSWLRGQGRPPCCRELGKPSWLRAP
ncbi:MAG: (deoxy)nucleoside triphosphate pyrophosphohydrolase, partial [Victivallales bacterium]|nr:(deoxy)nucleoside triphosphate pyrophosphohydrolase [Victivallales bacterium]